jgi:hypothetical protein
MRVKSACVFPALLVSLILVSAGGAYAQRLHNEERDKQAQEALKLAEEITSKSSFESQLKNLDLLAKRDVELHFRGARRQMELEIRGFRTWGDVSAFAERVKGTLNTADFIPPDVARGINADLERECPDRTTELGRSTCTAEAELSRLKKAVKDSEDRGKALDEELKTRLEKIGVVESLVERAKTFLKGDSPKNETIKDLSAVFINLSKTYVNYINKLAEINNQPRDDLRLLLQRVAVETLQLEADHWETVGEIQLRRVEEQKDLNRLVKDVEFRLAQIPKCVPSTKPGQFKTEKITDTFAKAQKIVAAWRKGLADSQSAGTPLKDSEGVCSITDPEDPAGNTDLPKEELVAYLFQALHSAAALAARGDTPMRLAQIRLAQEEHRYSIRQSAVLARGYELTLSSGTKRLGRFYAGGLRPEKISQLIYTAATVAIPAVIAGK